MFLEAFTMTGKKNYTKWFWFHFINLYLFELIYIGWIGDVWNFYKVQKIQILTCKRDIFIKLWISNFSKKWYFWWSDVENWVWAKSALWICPILWIRVQIGYTQLSLTFFHYYRPIWQIYHTSKKIIFMKKSHIFGSKICSREARSGPTAKSL